MNDEEYAAFVTAANESNEDAMFADGFDNAIIGIAHGAGRPSVVVYDSQKVIEILMEEHDMSAVDAEEYAAFNVFSAYVGEGTPLFLDSLETILDIYT